MSGSLHNDDRVTTAPARGGEEATEVARRDAFRALVMNETIAYSILQVCRRVNAKHAMKLTHTAARTCTA